MSRRQSGAYGFSPIGTSRPSSIISEAGFGFGSDNEDDDDNFDFEDQGEEFGFGDLSPSPSFRGGSSFSPTNSRPPSTHLSPNSQPPKRRSVFDVVDFEQVNRDAITPQKSPQKDELLDVQSKKATQKKFEDNSSKRVSDVSNMSDRLAEEHRREAERQAQFKAEREQAARAAKLVQEEREAARKKREEEKKRKDEETASSVQDTITFRKSTPGKYSSKSWQPSRNTAVDFSLLQNTMSDLRTGKEPDDDNTLKKRAKSLYGGRQRSTLQWPPRNEPSQIRTKNPLLDTATIDEDESTVPTDTTPIQEPKKELTSERKEPATNTETTKKWNTTPSSTTKTTTTNKVYTMPKVKTSSTAEPTKTAANEDEYEDLDPKAIEAANWTTDQIFKLIEQIKLNGVEENGNFTIKFKVLFEATENIFDALSGICKTAKKYKVIEYESEQLWQGRNDDTVITLLKETFDGVKIGRRKKQVGIPSSAKSKGFGTVSQQNSKCAVCGKTVYAAEYIGASEKAFHKTCFRCFKCNKMLSQNDFYVSRDFNFRCRAHHTEFEQQHF
eukprot:m.32061 g.32061  ORF g.32061 m.32061 type:complete len:555 (+) comp8374_c0_seq1:166-1830(+)